MSKRTLSNSRRATRGRAPRAGREPFSRRAVVSRVVALVESRPKTSLHLADLCTAVGVSERTLRSIFREQVGMNPKKYLRTQKLRAIREALVRADGASETVSVVATRFGLSDAGRMARDYFNLFGEYPGKTLAHRQGLRRRGLR